MTHPAEREVSHFLRDVRVVLINVTISFLQICLLWNVLSSIPDRSNLCMVLEFHGIHDFPISLWLSSYRAAAAVSKSRNSKNWQETGIFIITKSWAVNLYLLFLRGNKFPMSILQVIISPELEGRLQYKETHFIVNQLENCWWFHLLWKQTNCKAPPNIVSLKCPNLMIFLKHNSKNIYKQSNLTWIWDR